MRTPPHRRGLTALLALCTAALGTAIAVLPASPAAAFTAVPHGVPARPAAPATPDPSLQVHALASAPGPLDNPLKGFADYYAPGADETIGFPHSFTWSYFGLSEVMTDPSNCNSYNWSVVDSALNEIATYGNQAAIRFYMEYPGGTGTHPADAIPHCFDGNVTYRSNDTWGTTSPDYDSPFLLNAVGNLIAAYGARYDGDPRIGFINLGIVGLWGEWHTWPYDTDTTSDNLPNYMPTDAHAAQIIQDYANAFHKTKLEVRYPTSGGGAANNLDIGYHDDSFCYKEGTPLAGVTLPQSMGGATYAQLQLDLNEGTENKWITDSMGGEVRPEIQSSLFSSWPNGSGQADSPKACIEMEHTTWKIDQASLNYSATDPNVGAAVRLMGYDLSVTNAYFKNTASGTTNIGVQMTNDGVAPFYYPWTVTLGLKDSSGTVIKTWDTSWDLRTVMPLKIRAFPDWGVGSDPTYLDYGYPQYFQSAVDLSAVTGGSYQLVMRVKNPLEATSANAKKLRFANATQNADGWLGLGAMTVGSGGSGDTTAPTTPTGLASPSHTSNTVALSWTASTDNVGVTGYQVFRNGTQVGTPTGTSYTDSGLTASTAYTYTVKAYDAAGNMSAASSPLSVTTSAGSSDTTAPSTPTGLTSPSHTSTSIALSWTASTDNVGVTGYQVLRNGTQVGTSTGTTYTDSGLTASTAYTYTVKAHDAAGNVSAASSSVAVTTSSGSGDTSVPTVPNGLASPSHTANSIALTWNAATDNVGVTGYQVLRNGTVVATSAGTSYTDTGLVASTSYTYQVTAYDAAGNVSAPSSSITLSTNSAGTDTAAPSVPSGLTSGGHTASTVALSWTASTDNVGVTGYQILRGGTQVGSSTGTSYSDTGLTASTAYTYTVKAYDAGGNVSAASSPLTVTTSSNADTTAPSVPTGLTSAGQTASTVALSWTASTDNVGVTGYQVLRNGTQVGTSTGTSYTDSGLTASTAYTYTVKAYDAAGNVSAASSSVAVTTGAATTSTSYEAEAAGNTLAGTAVVSSCTGCSGSSKVGYLGNGGTVAFNGVNGGTGGATTVTVSYVSAVARSAQISVNGGTATTVSFPATADWNTVGTASVTLTLAAGTGNTIKIANPSDWASDIDRIVVGTTAPPSPTSYEAEAATNTLSGGAVTASCSTCSGGSEIGYIGNGGKLVMNGINGGTGRTKTLTIYYVSATNRNATVQVNAGTATSVTFPATGDWSTVMSVQVTVTLAAGTANTITFANPSDWAPDIDRITIS